MGQAMRVDEGGFQIAELQCTASGTCLPNLHVGGRACATLIIRKESAVFLIYNPLRTSFVIC